MYEQNLPAWQTTGVDKEGKLSHVLPDQISDVHLDLILRKHRGGACSDPFFATVTVYALL
ncbi:hypothetical protein KDI_54240 [Dictyobacter arantiisoli]|uniref:Uncharacterized protein n=1 Tax=Dictyobacter arantiisoli TaxID=2014874 RepID=A0A5A5TJS8_9CHLR|nr:hypothetical protein KDI_54240 [Dictyobacter arantiisoli]